MKFTLPLMVAVMAHLASATFGHHKPQQPVCGTTTITEVCKTATKTSYSHFPTVTSTVTVKKNFCDAKTTKTTTEIHTIFKETKVYTTPTVVSTILAPKVHKTVTQTAKVTGCPPEGKGKRHFLEERTASVDDEDIEDDEHDEDDYEGLTNAERLRRGLPLAKPLSRRTWCREGKCLWDYKPDICKDGKCYTKPKVPVPAGPSCVPKTVKVETTKTVTKSVTPTKYVTTTKCGHTKTATSTVCVTTSTTKWTTKTKTAHPTTIITKVTPTKTATVHATITVAPKEGCRK